MKQLARNCFWPTGCADAVRCNVWGFCIARWQAEHKHEIWPTKHGGAAPIKRDGFKEHVEYVVHKLRQRAADYYKKTHREYHYSNGDAAMDDDAADLLEAAINSRSASSANPSATKGTGVTPAPDNAKPPAVPAAWIEHHKGGDNLCWDYPGGKATPLYAPPKHNPSCRLVYNKITKTIDKVRDGLVLESFDPPVEESWWHDFAQVRNQGSGY